MTEPGNKNSFNKDWLRKIASKADLNASYSEIKMNAEYAFEEIKREATAAAKLGYFEIKVNIFDLYKKYRKDFFSNSEFSKFETLISLELKKLNIRSYRKTYDSLDLIITWS